MTQEENNILRDAYYFLRDHNDPPAPGSEGCSEFWSKTTADVGKLCGSWNNHLLITGMLMAIYEYLGQKGRAKGV